MKSNRILYIVPTANIGGAETFIQHTAKYHERYKPIYALLRDGALKEWLKEGKQLVELAPVFPRLRDPLSQVRTVVWLRDVAKKYEVDLIHSNMAYGSFFGSVLSKIIHVPHIWFQHGPASGWMDTLAGALPHRAVLVNSRFTGKTQLELERKIPGFLRPQRRLELFQLGVDFTSIDPIKNTAKLRENLRGEILSQCGLPSGTPIAGMLCRLQPWKGVHLFLKAIREVNKTKPLAGVIWGGSASRNESADYFSDLKKMISEMKIPVSMPGPTDAPLLALAAVDIVVNASIQPEPFGLSIVEGMCMGAFPVVPDEGGAEEIVSLSQIGLTFRARDNADLARKLCDALSELNFGRSDALRETARRLFDARRSILSLEQIYGSILEAPTTSR